MRCMLVKTTAARQVQAAEGALYEKGNCLTFACNLPVLPAVRQNRNSRWGPQGQRAQGYNAAKAAISDLLAITMKQQGIEPFPKDARLSVTMHIESDSFWVAIEQKAQGQLPKGFLKGDWDNLAKCVCDAMQGIAFANDSQIDKASVDVLRW